jgi:hypothetical protein
VTVEKDDADDDAAGRKADAGGARGAFSASRALLGFSLSLARPESSDSRPPLPPLLVLVLVHVLMPPRLPLLEFFTASTDADERLDASPDLRVGVPARLRPPDAALTG